MAEAKRFDVFTTFREELGKKSKNQGIDNPRGALEVLAYKADATEYTLLGHLLANHLCVSPLPLNLMHWIVVQYQGHSAKVEKPKMVGDNIQAIAIKHSRQEELDVKFRDFYDNWEGKTEGWVSGNWLIQQLQRHLRANPYAHAIVSRSLSTQITKKLKESARFKHGHLAIHTLSKQNDYVEVVHRDYQEPLQISVAEKSKPAELWGWLSEYETKKVGNWVYLGINFSDSINARSSYQSTSGDEHDLVRLWIFIEAPTATRVEAIIAAMGLLENLLENYFVRAIRTVGFERDESLWRVLDLGQDVNPHKPGTREYLDTAHKLWNDQMDKPGAELPAIWKLLHIENSPEGQEGCLRPLFGSHAAFYRRPNDTGNWNRLDFKSILFLVAYVSLQIRSLNSTFGEVVDFPKFEGADLPRSDFVLSDKTDEPEKDLVILVVRVLRALIPWSEPQDKKKPRNFSLQTVRFNKEGVELIFGFDPHKTSRIRNLSLLDGLRHNLTPGRGGGEQLGGNTTKLLTDLIRELAERTARQDVMGEENVIFPLSSPLTFASREEKDGEDACFILRFGARPIQTVAGPVLVVPPFNPTSNSIGLVALAGDSRRKYFEHAIGRVNDDRGEGLSCFFYEDSKWKRCGGGQEDPGGFLFILSHRDDDSIKLLEGIDHVVWYSGSGRNNVWDDRRCGWPDKIGVEAHASDVEVSRAAERLWVFVNRFRSSRNGSPCNAQAGREVTNWPAWALDVEKGYFGGK